MPSRFHLQNPTFSIPCAATNNPDLHPEQTEVHEGPDLLAPLLMTAQAIRKNAAKAITAMTGGEYAQFSTGKSFRSRHDGIFQPPLRPLPAQLRSQSTASRVAPDSRAPRSSRVIHGFGPRELLGGCSCSFARSTSSFCSLARLPALVHQTSPRSRCIPPLIRIRKRRGPMENRNSRKLRPQRLQLRAFTQARALGVVRRRWSAHSVRHQPQVLGRRRSGGRRRLLIYRAASSTAFSRTTVHVQKSVTIMKPVAEVFSFWRNFENLPHIMTHLESVRLNRQALLALDRARPSQHPHRVGRRDHRRARKRVHRLAFLRRGRHRQPRIGAVLLRPQRRSHGTDRRHRLRAACRTPREQPSRKLFGEEPEQQVREDLAPFQSALETGEIPTIEGQPSGRRSAWVRMMQNAYAEPKKQPRARSMTNTPAQELA